MLRCHGFIQWHQSLETYIMHEGLFGDLSKHRFVMATRIALLRGINVGKARRLPMVELRGLLEEIGFRDVRTMLNTGNIVFETDDASAEELELEIASAISQRFDFDVPTMVLSPEVVQQVIDENPIADAADDPSRFLIAFLGADVDRQKLMEIEDQAKPTEAFALRERAAYLWCPDGISKSRAAASLLKPTYGTLTTRNLRTTLKLCDLAKG